MKQIYIYTVIECVPPSFGPDCLHICNCLGNDTCDRVNGTCPGGCAAGWHGASCNLGTYIQFMNRIIDVRLLYCVIIYVLFLEAQ